MRIKLDIPLTLTEIKECTGGLLNTADMEINHICTDSRFVEKGDLFFAISGEKYDGRDFIADVLKKGGFVLSESADASIRVINTRAALLSLASYYKKKLPCLNYTVAITGSVGKTTTRNFLSEILKQEFKVHASEKNYNNELGVSYTLLSASKATEIIIAEIGMNHPGEIERLSCALEPDIAIITNIGNAHIGNLGSKEAIASAKLEINRGMKKNGITVVIAEESLLRSAMGRFTVSLSDPYSDCFLIPLRETSNGSTFDFYSKNLVLTEQRISLPGRHILSSLALAIGAATQCGATSSGIQRALKCIGQKSIRQRLFTIGRYLIYDDTYSSSPEAVLAVMKMLTLYRDKSKSAVLGDMLELGEKSEELHRMMGQNAAKHGFNKLYLFGSFAKFTAEGAIQGGIDEKNIYINTGNDYKLTASQIKGSYDGELLLFKGSHAVHTEKIYEYLEEG